MIRRDLTPVINFLVGVVLHSRRLIEKSKKLQKIIDDETAKRFEEALAKRRHNQCRRPD